MVPLVDLIIPKHLCSRVPLGPVNANQLVDIVTHGVRWGDTELSNVCCRKFAKSMTTERQGAGETEGVCAVRHFRFFPCQSLIHIHAHTFALSLSLLLAPSVPISLINRVISDVPGCGQVTWFRPVVTNRGSASRAERWAKDFRYQNRN